MDTKVKSERRIHSGTTNFFFWGGGGVTCHEKRMVMRWQNPVAWNLELDRTTWLSTVRQAFKDIVVLLYITFQHARGSDTYDLVS